MSIFKKMLSMVGNSDNKDNFMDDRYWTNHSSYYHDGHVAVTPETVIEIPTVYACLKVLSETISMLPMVSYKKETGSNEKKVLSNHLSLMFNEQPNAYQDACEWRKCMTYDALLYGNAFSMISQVGVNSVGSLNRIHPDNVSLKNNDKGGYFYQVRFPNDVIRNVSPQDMFHLRIGPLCGSNIWAESVIDYGKRAFAKALLLNDYATNFFKNDATPGGIISLKGEVMTKEQAKLFKEKWQDQFSGRNRHKVAVLDMGGEWFQTTVSNDKAQFLDTVKETQYEILRLFRMPPHKVGMLERATFSKIEEQSLSFVTDTLLPIIVAWEKAVKRQLINNKSIHLVHNVAGLLRGDLKARYEAYATGRNWGWLSVNDIRKLEDLSPVDDGDTYLQPLNMTNVGTGMSSEAVAAQLAPQVIKALEYKRNGGKLA